MEHHFISFQALFTFFLFLFMVFRIWKTSNGKNSNLKLPPGPRKLPFIGNMHNLIGALPHRGFSDLAKTYGPLMHLQLGEVSTIIISSPEGAKEVMRTHDNIFAQRPRLLSMEILAYGSTNITFAQYGDYWRQLRKICVMELLSSKRVESFQSIREEEVWNMMKVISSSAGLPINLSGKIFSLTAGILSRAQFGKINRDQEEFLALLEEGVEELKGFSIADVFPSHKLLHLISGERAKLEKMHKKLDRILVNIINEHRTRESRTENGEDEPKRDLLGVLLNLQKQSELGFPLTDDNIKAVIRDIFAAGMDTSSTAVEWAMSEMIKNPRVMERAQAEVRQVFGGKGIVDEKGLHELKYLKLVIKETLRLHPPAPLLLPRESMESCQLFGYDIPVKTKVIINAWAIGRDPKYWKDAERFYPERFLDIEIDYKGANFEYIPFGSGRRSCPGMTFAMANMELPLASLLYHFDWKLDNGAKPEDLDMTEAVGITVRRKNDLYAIPVPSQTLSRD